MISLEKLIAYPTGDLPPEAKPNQIYVDMKNSSIILPICGYMVPFHISVLKNVSKHEEGKTTSMRINFHIPGAPGTVANIQFPVRL